MIGYRECNYAEPRYPITSEPVSELCACKLHSVDQCRTCGDPVCADCVKLCDHTHCWDAQAVYCPKCTVLIEGNMRVCHKHLAAWNQEDVA